MRISNNQAVDYFRSTDLVGLGMEADALRKRLHPEGVVTYALDYNIECAGGGTSGLQLGPQAQKGHFPSLESVCDMVGRILEEADADLIVESCISQPVEIGWLEQLLRALKQRFPKIQLLSLSAAEIMMICDHSQIQLSKTLSRLRDAGLDGLSENGSRTLCGQAAGLDRPQVCLLEDWLQVHRAAHAIGLRSNAALPPYRDSSFTEYVAQLEQMRRLQDETGGFRAFDPWTPIKAARERPPRAAQKDPRDEPTAVELLKCLAISRLYLDNIEHVQCGLTVQGLKMLQLGLCFGANDAGSISLPDSSVSASSGTQPSEEDLRRVIRDAGFQPVQRNALFNTFYLG